MRYKLTIAYDGTDFHGWQKQSNLPTVQGAIENALGKIFSKPIALTGASRTDTGVHAAMQVAHFDWDQPLRPGHDLRYGIQCLTPASVVITKIQQAPPEFHAITSTERKSYCYRILSRKMPCPLRRHQTVWMRQELNLERINLYLQQILGEHDFKSFQGANSDTKTTIRTVLAATARREGDEVVFEFTGTGFLKQMIRNLVGTVLMLDEEKAAPTKIMEIMKKRERKAAGPTAPTHGLCLMKINYPQSIDNQCIDLYE